jgi:hypothetical protein
VRIRVAENALTFAVHDNYPVSPGHTFDWDAFPDMPPARVEPSRSFHVDRKFQTDAMNEILRRKGLQDSPAQRNRHTGCASRRISIRKQPYLACPRDKAAHRTARRAMLLLRRCPRQSGANRPLHRMVATPRRQPSQPRPRPPRMQPEKERPPRRHTTRITLARTFPAARSRTRCHRPACPLGIRQFKRAKRGTQHLPPPSPRRPPLAGTRSL